MEIVNKANAGLVGGVLVTVAGAFGFTLAPEDVTIITGALATIASGVVILVKWINGRKVDEQE